MGIYFDIETFGLSPQTSSIASLAYTKNISGGRSEVHTLNTSPVPGSRLEAWPEKNI